MKGLTGLIVALVLGVLAVGLNWFYLESKTKNFKSTVFLGIKEDVTIKPGDPFQASHFEAVAIPTAHAKELPEFVYLYEDRTILENVKALRMYTGGELILKQDYRTPMPKLKPPAADEVLLPISVSERSPLIEPGDNVSFLIATPELGRGGNSSQLIGPFVVASIGNQVGSSDVMKAYGIQHLSSNQLNLLVKKEGEVLEASAMTLLKSLSQSNVRDIRVIWHGPKKS